MAFSFNRVASRNLQSQLTSLVCDLWVFSPKLPPCTDVRYMQWVCFSMFSVIFLICSLGIRITLSPVSPGLSPGFYCDITPPTAHHHLHRCRSLSRPSDTGSGLDNHPTAVPGGVSLSHHEVGFYRVVREYQVGRSRRERLASEAARLVKNLWDLFTWSVVYLVNSLYFLLIQ